MIDNNVKEDNYVLVFRNIVFTICYNESEVCNIGVQRNKINN